MQPAQLDESGDLDFENFQLDIADTIFAHKRKQDSIRSEAELDGIYVIRTNVPTPPGTPWRRYAPTSLR